MSDDLNDATQKQNIADAITVGRFHGVQFTRDDLVLIEMMRAEGSSYERIANKVGCSRGAVKKALLSLD